MNGIRRMGGSLGPVGVGLLLLGAGLLTAPAVAGTLRALLRYGAGWSLEPLWQRAIVTLVGVAAQNGVWFFLAWAYLRMEGLFFFPPWWNREPADSPGRAALRELGAGIRWGFLLLFLNGWTARLSLAFWERVLPPGRLAAKIAEERGILVTFFDPQQPGWLLAALLFTVVVVAPAGEEILFRGVLYRGLRVHMGPWAVPASAALFASIHLYVIHFLPVFVLGMLLALIYERRGNLLAPTVAHGFVNGLVALSHLVLRSAGLSP